jgi:hypothetical protein
MENQNNGREFRTMEKQPSGAMTTAFITMEAIFVKNPDSPIARDKSSSRKYAGLVLMLHEILPGNRPMTYGCFRSPTCLRFPK